MNRRTHSNPAAPSARLSPEASGGGLKARQQALRSKISEAGLDLFIDHGFDAVSVTQIAEAAGTSRRTFFRYFGSKEDVVFDWLDVQGDFVLGQLLLDSRAVPANQRMRGALIALAEHLDQDRARAALFTRVIFETPALSRRYRAENSRWEHEAVEFLKRGQPMRKDLELRVWVAAATAAFFTALRVWSEGPSTKPIEAWVREAFRTLMPD